jgi:hypothetical protein
LVVSKVIGVDAAAGEWLGMLLVDGLYAGLTCDARSPIS